MNFGTARRTATSSSESAEPGAPAPARRVRVIFGIDNLGIGGTELNAIRTAERLDPSRFELGVACLQEDGPLRERYAAAGIPVVPFPITSLYAPGTPLQGMRLARFLRDQRVDVFHAHDRYSNIFGAPWARLAGVRRVIASRRWWDDRNRTAHRIANRFAYRFAHAVLANSPRVGQLLVRTEGVPAHRVAVVPNFVEEDAFASASADRIREFRAELGIPPGAPTVGIIANLRAVKNHPSLLRAFALLRDRWPDAYLILVGDGDSRQSLETLAADLGIGNRVRLAGRRPNRPNLHHMFDVSVLCSLHEGLSNSILEAMAAGNPVIATAVGATPDAVLDGETGLLVPPSDPVRLSEAIDALLADPPRAHEMGAAGRRRVREQYSPHAALTALDSLYRERGEEPAAPRLRTAPGEWDGAPALPGRPTVL